tara:strand:- start:286 stop:576 length:291 start_codon:yes stop_codon:yes gene_type:complete
MKERIWNTEGQYEYKVEDLPVWEVGVVWYPYEDGYMTNCWRWFFDNEEDARKKEKFITDHWKEPSSDECVNHLWCQQIWVCKEPKKIKERKKEKNQ